jgi:hypothetical protein
MSSSGDSSSSRDKVRRYPDRLFRHPRDLQRPRGTDAASVPDRTEPTRRKPGHSDPGRSNVRGRTDEGRYGEGSSNRCRSGPGPISPPSSLGPPCIRAQPCRSVGRFGGRTEGSVDSPMLFLPESVALRRGMSSGGHGGTRTGATAWVLIDLAKQAEHGRDSGGLSQSVDVAFAPPPLHPDPHRRPPPRPR